jgi:hypothetical protein
MYIKYFNMFSISQSFIVAIFTFMTIANSEREAGNNEQKAGINGWEVEINGKQASIAV